MDLKKIVSDMLINRRVWKLHDDISRLRRMAFSLRLLVDQHFWAIVRVTDHPLVPDFRVWIRDLTGTFLQHRSEYFANDYWTSNLHTPHECEKPGSSRSDNWLTYYLKTFNPGDGGCVDTQLTVEIQSLNNLLSDIPVPTPTDSGLNGALVGTKDDLLAFLRVARLAWANVAMHRPSPTPRLGAPDLPPQSPRGAQWGDVHPLTGFELVSVMRAIDRFGVPHAAPPINPTLEEACAFVTAVIATCETPDPEIPDDDADLKGNAGEIVTVLYDGKAFDRNSRMSLDDVVAKARPAPSPGTGAYKKPAAYLVKKGIIGRKRGRGGGHWLTEKGKKEAEAM